MVVRGPTNDGNGALDVNGTFTISGGTLLAAGSSGMAVAPASSSTQGWVAMTFTSSSPAGTVVHIVAADGQVVASFTASKAFTSLVYSSAEISSGASYSVYTSGTVSGDGSAGSLTTAICPEHRRPVPSPPARRRPAAWEWVVGPAVLPRAPEAE